jgi:hypothetical protein
MNQRTRHQHKGYGKQNKKFQPVVFFSKHKIPPNFELLGSRFPQQSQVFTGVAARLNNLLELLIRERFDDQSLFAGGAIQNHLDGIFLQEKNKNAK